MSDDDWLSHEPLQQLTADLLDDVVARYRISASDADRLIAESFESDPQLREAVLASQSAARLKRTRAFKQAASAAKRSVYYYLRTYRAEDTRLEELIGRLEQSSDNGTDDEVVTQLLESHASTRERLPFREEFYERVFDVVSQPRTIIDVGCGIQPLMFPWNAAWAAGIGKYVALDSSRQDIRCVGTFAAGRSDQILLPVEFDIAEGWNALNRHADVEVFDLALMLKLVPVIHRQQRELLSTLHETPATRWLLSGSRVSMTKRQSIERREKRVLEEFVRMAGREVVADFVVGEEFVWLV